MSEVGRRRLASVPDVAPRAVLYLRQSISREESISLELQEIAGRAHCERSGYAVVEVLADPGISGRTWVRPAVQRAVGMIEAGQAEVIVVWKWSRFARSRRDWAVAVDRVEVAGGQLESATEPVDARTSTGRFTRGMLAELAAFESDRIGDTWRETHQQRRASGVPAAGGARFGYTPGTRSRAYEIDAEEGPLLRELYERYLRGDGFDQLVAWTAALGVLSPRTGRAWTRGGLISVLDSGFGAGLLRIHDPSCTVRHGAGNCQQRVYIAGQHEAVISEEVWEAYLEARRTRATLPPRLLSPVTRLSAVLRCEMCGRRMVVNRYAGANARYKCGNVRACPGRPSVTILRAEAAVLAWLPTVAGLVDEQAASAEPSTSASKGVERERLVRSAADAERALTQLAIDWARRMIPETAYVGARDALVEQRDQATAALAKLAGQGLAAAHVVEAAAGLLEDWDTIAPADCSRILQSLAVVWVNRRPGTTRPTITVRGVWEEQPRQ